jgi:lantibiotic modifying enzyme
LTRDTINGALQGRPAAWPRPNGPPLTGLSHGAAGIAHALFSLASRTDEERYLEAARDALRYERLRFVPELGNWEDLRPEGPPGGPRVMYAWCNGAPGIGLARVPWLTVDREASAEVAVAVATTRRHARGVQDHLCCGTLGRVELLLRAADVLDRPELAAEARTVAGAVVADARRRGRYLLSSPEVPPVDVPGLFRGLSGVGLQLLRLTFPERVPSPLLLD